MNPAPKTLLQMAGAPQQPSSWSASTLLLIDCQNEYVDGALALPGVTSALAQIQAMSERARAARAPIVHVVHRGQAGGPFDLAGHRGEIAAPLQIAAGEMRVEKRLPNAFADTDLATVLRGTGRKQLIVGGFMTHMCVSSTVRAALDLDFRCTVVAAATATRDLPDLDGGIVSADQLQRASLAALADRFAIVARDADAIPDQV